jgi:hypothetical protein
VAATPVRRYDKILILPEIEHENGKTRKTTCKRKTRYLKEHNAIWRNYATI